MANILSVTCGFKSILYPSIELARRLHVEGHQVTFASHAEAQALVEHQGLRFLPLAASRYEEFLAADAKLGPLRRLRSVRDRRQQAKEAMAVEDFARTVRELELDLVLLDGEMHEHILVALGSGVPVALLNSFASIWRRPGLPPAHCLVRPGVGWRGRRAGMALLWFALRLRKWRIATSLRLRRVGCDRLALLRLLADENSLDLRRLTDESHWLIPFTYRHLPVLSLHALEFEFPHRPLDHVHYVGPLSLKSRIDRPMAEEHRAELEAVFERRRAGGASKLIYAGFGSVLSTDLSFLKRLLGVVAERPTWELVISLSDRVAPAALGPLPERVHAFPWVPQLQVLQAADVVITHGGINTIDECVLRAVPMLVYCGFQTDMAGNTARVVHHGIGLAGNRRRDRTSTVVGHLDRLLHEPGFKANLRRLQKAYLSYGEDQVLEQVVESLLSRTGKDSLADGGRQG